MSFLSKLFGKSSKPSLKNISEYFPNGMKAVETRPFQECKQVSAYVVFDTSTNAVVVYVDMALGWIHNLKPIAHRFEPLFDEDGLSRNSQNDTPQLVSIGETLFMNRYTSMRILLMTSSTNATHITIPCPPDAFNEFRQDWALFLISFDDAQHFLLGSVDNSKREHLLNTYVKALPF